MISGEERIALQMLRRTMQSPRIHVRLVRPSRRERKTVIQKELNQVKARMRVRMAPEKMSKKMEVKMMLNLPLYSK
jgi:hypothetical protein